MAEASIEERESSPETPAPSDRPSPGAGERAAAALSWLGRQIVALGAWLGRELTRLGRWLRRLYAVRVLGFQIQDLQQDRGRLFTRIGEQVYLLYQKHMVQNPDVVALCEEVRELDALIEEKDSEREARRRQPLLPEPAESPTVAETPLEGPS